jgi:hypothetical protein
VIDSFSDNFIASRGRMALNASAARSAGLGSAVPMVA